VYRTAAILLGIGLGGLAESILLQDLLQLHTMLSAVTPAIDAASIRANLRWTGVDNAVCFVAVFVGAISLYRAARNRMPVPPPRRFAGFLLIGWGGFNLVEGLLDHAILRIHHVVEGPHALLGDFLFLAVGAAGFIVLGAIFIRPRRDWMTRTSTRRRRRTPW
jgi:uncharacterized membrane protein